MEHEEKLPPARPTVTSSLDPVLAVGSVEDDTAGGGSATGRSESAPREVAAPRDAERDAKPTEARASAPRERDKSERDKDGDAELKERGRRARDDDSSDDDSSEDEQGGSRSDAPKKRAGKPKAGKQPNNVRKLRIERMMSKAELARRAGLSVLTIDRVEKGFGCRMDSKRKILEALGLSLADRVRVFGEEE